MAPYAPPKPAGRNPAVHTGFLRNRGRSRRPESLLSLEVRRKTSHLLLLAAAPSASAAERYRDEKAHIEAPKATYFRTTMTTNTRISDAVWDEDRSRGDYAPM